MSLTEASAQANDAFVEGATSQRYDIDVPLGAATIQVPVLDGLGAAAFTRSGGDLVIAVGDESTVVVAGWFDHAHPPAVATADGAMLAPDTIERLVGPLAPGQVAQLDLGPLQPVGHVVTVEGSVNALRVDGTIVPLEAGAPLYPGDVLESSPGAAAGFVLADGTTLAMAENARFVLDDVIYAGGANDTLSLTVLDGVFTFTSGEIAAGDPEAMTISSPSAIAGVRGTRVGIEIEPDGDETWFLLPDLTGHVGSYSLTYKLSGDSLLLNHAFQAVTADGGILRLLVLSPEAIVDALGEALLFEPENRTRAENVEPDPDELARLAAALSAIAPAAGGTDAESPDGPIQTVLDPSLWSFLENGITGVTLAVLFDSSHSGDHRESTGATDHDESFLLVQAIEDPVVRLSDAGELFLGTDGPDTVIGGAGGDRIFGAGGDDVLDGGAGGDTLDGGPGDDAVFGGVGDDLIVGGSGQGDDLLAGGPGNDTVTFTSALQPIVVDLNAGTAAGDPAIGSDTLGGVEHVIGGQANDVILGNGAGNSLSGGAGDDVLRGSAGDDALVGGTGSDIGLFDGPATRYAIGPDGPNVTIADTTGVLGTDTLSGVEIARFADRDLVFDGVNDAPTLAAGGAVAGTVVHTTFVHDFGALPPESDIDPASPNGVPQDALSFDHDHTVTATFVEASTGYRDIFGVYDIGAGGAIENVRVLFPNTDDKLLEPGVSEVSFDVTAGDRIGFFIVADGATLNDLDGLGAGHFEFLDAVGAQANLASADPRLVFRGDDGTVTDILFRAGDGVFHSAAPSLNTDGEVHVASGLAVDGGLTLAFEVQPDAVDFDDLVVQLVVEPSVESTFDPLAPLPNVAISDVDGVGLVAATVTLAGLGGDTLSFGAGLADALGLEVGAIAGGFAITGAASFDAYETLLESLTLANDNPVAGDRTLTLTVFDSAGAASSVEVDIGIDEQFVDGAALGFTAFADVDVGDAMLAAVG